MNPVESFLKELEDRSFPKGSLRESLRRIESSMTPDEKSRASTLIAIIETEQTRERQKLTDLLPKGWLSDYLAYTQVSEAPDSFHLFCGLAVLSHMIGRRVWINIGLKTLYAPISVFLVSPAGAAKRSTAMDAAVQIGKDAGAETIQDMMTPEGLIDFLGSSPGALVVSDEAASLLSKSDYMTAMPQLLCTLLDCKPRYERKLRGTYQRVEKPTVNLLMGCAPEWILTSMPASALKGGLFSRLILVYEPTRKRLIAFPDDEVETETMAKMGRELSTKLRATIDALGDGGRLVYQPKAKAMFRKFYEDNAVATNAADDKMAVYLGRKPDHAHRILMSLIVSSGAPLEVTEELLHSVLAILHLVEEGMSFVYENAGLEKSGQVNYKILKVIEKSGGRMSRSEIMRKLGLNAKELTESLKSLGEAGLVIERRVMDKRGHPTMYEAVRSNGSTPGWNKE